MATVIIPVSTHPHHELQVKLDGVVYTLELRWNRRDSGWYLTVKDEADAVLVASRRLVCDWPIVGLREQPPVLPGQLWVYDTSGEQLDPTLEDLGTRVLLLYEEAA